MSFATSLLPINQTHLNIDLTKTISDNKPLAHTIKANTTGIYTISHTTWQASPTGTLYDNGQKILHWQRNHDYLILETHTSAQVNFTFADTVNHLVLKALGAVLIDGQLTIQQTGTLVAHTLAVKAIVQGNAALSLSASQSLSIFSPLRSQALQMEAAYIYQAACIDIANHLVMIGQCIQQCQPLTAQSCQIVATQCQLRHRLHIKEQAFIATTTLACESDTTHLRLPTNLHLHTVNWYVDQRAVVRLGQTPHNQPSAVIVDNHWLIGQDATVALEATHAKVNQLINDGHLTITNSQVDATNLVQQGHFTLENTKLVVSETMTVDNQVNMAHSDVQAITINQNRGQWQFTNSLCVAEQMMLLSGGLTTHHSTLELSDCLFIDDEAQVGFNNSQLTVANHINNGGHVTLQQTIVQTDFWENTNHPLVAEHSELLVLEQLRLGCGAQLQNTFVKTNNLDLHGTLAALALETQTDTVTINSDCVTIDQWTAYSTRLLFTGNTAADPFIISNAILVTKHLICQTPVRLDTSVVYGIAPHNHSVHSHLTLNQSHWVTEGHVANQPNAVLTLQSFSRLYAQRLFSQGIINAIQANIDCDTFLQQQGQLLSDASDITVNHGFHSRQSQTHLTNQSVLNALAIKSSAYDYLCASQASKLHATQIITGEHAQFVSDHSSIKSQQFYALGTTLLINSLLSAEEARFYQQFAATHHSFVTIDHALVLAAQSLVSESKLACNTLSLDGTATLVNSSVNAKKQINTWSTSQVALAGVNQLSAPDVTFTGELRTHATAQLPGYTHINATKSFTTTQNAQITGNAPLTIAAESVLHSGDLTLDAPLNLQGTLLRNYGTLAADNLSAGFDEAVINLGYIAGDNLTINSNLVNLLGSIWVKQQYTNTGLYSINAGLICANNYHNSNLVSTNLGLVVPNLSADAQYLLSLSNLISGGRFTLNTFLPHYSSMVNGVLMLPALGSTLTNGYKLGQTLTWERMQSMRLHEWYPVINQVKNAVSLGISAYHTGVAVSNEVGQVIDTLSSNKSETWVDQLYNQIDQFIDNPLPLASQCLGLLASSYTDEALISWDSGLTVAGNTFSNNVVGVHAGLSYSLFNNSFDSQLLYNIGWSGGTQASYQAKHLVNAGTLNGINELHLTTPTAVNATTGHILGGHSQVLIDDFSQQGEFVLQSGNAIINQFNTSSLATNTLTGVHLSGQTLTSNGHIACRNSELAFRTISLGQDAHEQWENSVIRTSKLVDNSHLSYAGEVTILANDYQHTGHIDTIANSVASANSLAIKANSGALLGSGTLDNAHIAIANLANPLDFLNGHGQYAPYQINNHLTLDLEQGLTIRDPITRDCDITLKATAIKVLADYQNDHHLAFISTKGSVDLLDTFKARSLYVQSASDITTNGTLYTQDNIVFAADGHYYNLGGTVNGEKVAVKAANIKNISARSEQAKLDWGNAMDDGGIISGRTDTLLESTQGDIENFGGVIRSGHYTQLIAKGNVYNGCNSVKSLGAHDTVVSFDGGLIAGGTGSEATQGIGLFIQSGGKLISDASDFISSGHNYVFAEQGYDLQSRSNTYVAEQWTKKKWYGKKETFQQTATTIKNSVFHSDTGINVLKNGSGDVLSVGTRFSSPQGTLIESDKPVLLYNLKTTSSTQSSKSKLWGLSKTTHQEWHQNATPTLFIDNGLTKITSKSGFIDATGAYFIGKGDVVMQAYERIKLGTELLANHVEQSKRDLSFSAPGMHAWQALRQGGNLLDMATAEDATLAKLKNLRHSDNNAEWLAHGANLGIDLYNTTASAMRGLTQGSLSNEMMARYGLGGAQGFSPSVTLALGTTKTITDYHSQSIGGIDREGHVNLKAPVVELANGVAVRSGGTIDVDAESLLLTSAGLTTTIQQSNTTAGITFNPAGVQNVSVSHSECSSQQIQQHNALLSAAGTIKLHHGEGAMSLLTLNGANIEANALEGSVEKLIINDQQDTAKQTNRSASISSNGQLSGYQGHQQATVTAQKSGIHTRDGLNTNGHTLAIHDAAMTGGYLTTDGDNRLTIDHLSATTMHDTQVTKGSGFSVNVHDLARLAGQQPGHQAGETAIAQATIQINRDQLISQHTPVLYGKTGNDMSITTLEGEIHTSSADSTCVVVQTSFNADIALPLTNTAYLETSQATIHAGGAQLSQQWLQGEEEEEEEEELSFDPLKPEQVANSPELSRVAAEELEQTAQLLEQVLKNALAKLSPEELAALQQRLAKQQQQQHDKANTHDESDNRVEKALLEALKESSKTVIEHAGERISHQAGQSVLKKLAESNDLASLGIPFYFSSKGLLITFSFNLGLASVNSEVKHQDIIKEGLITSTSDITIGLLLKYTTGASAGPIGWGLVGCSIIDTLTFDPHSIEQFIDEGIANMAQSRHAFHEHDYFAGVGAQSVAAAQFDAAGNQQLFHQIAQIPERLTEGLKAMWNGVTQQDGLAERTLRFFKPAKTIDSKAGLLPNGLLKP